MRPRRLIVKELGITIDEGGGLASRAGTYTDLSTGKPVAVQPKDVPMLAAVRAAGPGAELWSLDGGVKQNAARFGVNLAPESKMQVVRITREDVRAGLNNVGLQSWEIAADGTPVRRGQLIGGSGGGGAVSPAPTRTGGGGGGTSSGGGGAVPPAPTRTGGGGGGTSSGGGGLTAMGGGLLTAGWTIAVPLFKRWFAENHLQKRWTAEQDKKVADAIAAHSPKFDLLIKARQRDIMKARARNSPVILRVVVHTEWIDTDWGPAQTDAVVAHFQLLFEGDTAIEWPLFQPKTSFAGAVVEEPKRRRRRRVVDMPL